MASSLYFLVYAYFIAIVLGVFYVPLFQEWRHFTEDRPVDFSSDSWGYIAFVSFQGLMREWGYNQGSMMMVRLQVQNVALHTPLKQQIVNFIVFCDLLNDRSGSPMVLRATLDALDARDVGLLFVGSQGRGVQLVKKWEDLRPVVKEVSVTF